MIMARKMTCLIFFVIISSCGMRHHGKLRTKDIINEIVLINGGNYDRCKMGELITSISNCHPKVIGLDFLFIGRKVGKCDSILELAIRDSEKVVLSEGYENGRHVQSDDLFLNPAMLTGVRGLIQTSNGVTKGYLRLTHHHSPTPTPPPPPPQLPTLAPYPNATK
jgi:hypothetical protein